MRIFRLCSTFPKPPLLQVVLITLLHALEQNSSPFTLVLDDYQFIDARQVHELVAFMLDHLPSGMHLVISSRIRPPFPLGTLTIQWAVLGDTTDHLRFTVSEAGNYLNKAMGLRLSAKMYPSWSSGPRDGSSGFKWLPSR